jgi:tetratricopeptide (TPR) repeat protein
MRSSLGLFLTVLGGLFVVVVGILLFIQLAEKKEGKAQFHFSKAKLSFESYKSGQGEAATKALDEMKKELEVLSKEFPSSRANQLAEGLRAQWALKEKRSDDAVKALRAFEKALPSREKDIARIPLGVALEDANQWEEARQVYVTLGRSSDPYFIRLGLMGEARTLRKLNRKSEAAEIYKKFLEKYGSSAEALTVRGLLAEIQSEKIEK